MFLGNFQVFDVAAACPSWIVNYGEKKLGASSSYDHSRRKRGPTPRRVVRPAARMFPDAVAAPMQRSFSFDPSPSAATRNFQELVCFFFFLHRRRDNEVRCGGRSRRLPAMRMVWVRFPVVAIAPIGNRRRVMGEMQFIRWVPGQATSILATPEFYEMQLMPFPFSFRYQNLLYEVASLQAISCRKETSRSCYAPDGFSPPNSATIMH